MIAVIDTSAFLRLFIPDGPVPSGLEAFLRGVERGENLALAPELMLAEAANVAVKKRAQGVLTDDECSTLLGLIRKAPVHYTSHADSIEVAARLAVDFRLTVYDALFLALAKQRSCVLFTADAKLAKAARRLGLTAA
jgi:predicted nucleic acid-binding protein